MGTALADDLTRLVADPWWDGGDLLPLMRGIEGLLDPSGILNPGIIFEP